MIEQALYEHLKSQMSLSPFLATYNGSPAVFNQEAPADRDGGWGQGPQYGRVVFSVNMEGDPERCMGGVLAVDSLCKEGEQVPEQMEPVIRDLIHGWFFSKGTFTVAAQWKNSDYFTEIKDHVIGCTSSFNLLGFPVLTTSEPDVVRRINTWTSQRFENLHVINHDPLPSTAWKPTGDESAVYWRLLTDGPAKWIPDTFQTIWRTATLKCHIFSKDNASAAAVARSITTALYADKRMMKDGESPIMVNRANTVDLGADPLRTGQLTVEATYGIIVNFENEKSIQNIKYNDEKGDI